MEEDLVFNMDDLNITQEEVEFITEDTTKAEEVVEDTTTTVEDTNKGEETSEQIEDTTDISSEESPSSTETNSSQHSTLYALVQHLKDEGVLYLDSEEIKVDSLEDLKTLIAESNQKAKFSGMTDSQRRYYEALENGIPTKDYEQVEKDIQVFSNIDPDSFEQDAQLRYEVIAIDLIDKGIPREKAIKLAELAAQQDTAITDAKEALTNIIANKQKAYDELINSTKEKNTTDINTIKESIYKKDEILGMKLNDITKNKLFNQMTTRVGSTDDGLPVNEFQKWQIENPVESNILLNYLYLVTEKGTNLGIIKKTNDSSAAKELEKKLQSLNFDKDGGLIIPDHFTSGSKNNNKDKNNNLTINI